jgi:hypothetical protein
MDDRKELELLIHRRLRELPELQAPATLAPRVLEALQWRTEHRWWRRPWRFWSWPLRLLALSLISLAISLAVSALYLVQVGAVQPLWAALAQQLAGWAFLWDVPRALVMALGTVLRSSVGPYWIYGLGLVSVMYVACIGLGTAFVRLTFQPQTGGQ